MANWQSANVSAFLPESLSTLVDTASTTASTVSGVLNAIGIAIEAISSILIGLPSFDFAGALILAVNQFKEDFLGTGFYACNMWDYPLQQFYKSGVSGESFVDSFEADLVGSFDDPGDPNVPSFNGSTAALVLVGGVSGLGPVAELVNQFANAFSWWTEIRECALQLSRVVKESEVLDALAAVKDGRITNDEHPSRRTLLVQQLQNSLDQMRRDLSEEVVDELDTPTSSSSLGEIENFINAVSTLNTPSVYPDWQQISLRTIAPPLVDVVDQVFEPLIQALQTGRNIVAALESFITALDEKISALESVVANIELYLSQLEALLSATGLYALYVSSDSGMTGLASEINGASNKPFAGLDSGFYSGVTIVAGGANLAPFNNLFAPIGGG